MFEYFSMETIIEQPMLQDKPFSVYTNISATTKPPNGQRCGPNIGMQHMPICLRINSSLRMHVVSTAVYECRLIARALVLALETLLMHTFARKMQLMHGMLYSYSLSYIVCFPLSPYCVTCSIEQKKSFKKERTSSTGVCGR